MLKFFIKLKKLMVNFTINRHLQILLDAIQQAELKNRTQFFDREDFNKASVLDINCGIGTMSLLSLQWGAREVVGVEYDQLKFRTAEEYGSGLRANSRLTFLCDDLNLFSFWNMIESKDVTLFLPLSKTSDPLKAYGALARLAAKTKKVMYLEGQPGGNYSEYFNDLLTFTDFHCIEYKGETDVREDGTSRPFFRCSREYLTQYQAVEKIKEFMKNSTYNKIAVVGKAGAGKSYTRKLLAKMIDFQHDYELVDDKCGYEYPNSLPKIVFFIYGGLTVIQDIEAVFFINLDEDLRRNQLFKSDRMRVAMKKLFGHRIIPPRHFSNHSPAGNMSSLKAVYTIKR